MTEATWHTLMTARESSMKHVGKIRVQVIITQAHNKILADYPLVPGFIIHEVFRTRDEAFKYYDEIEKHLFLAFSNT